jgi:hypothetical protein
MCAFDMPQNHESRGGVDIIGIISVKDVVECARVKNYAQIVRLEETIFQGHFGGHIGHTPNVSGT